MTMTIEPPVETSTALTAMDQLFNISDYVTEEEREWQMKARKYAQERIRPTIDDDFENKVLRTEMIREIGELGFFGLYLKGYGCQGASSVAYGLVAMEFEAVDSGFRTVLSVLGSLAMGAIYKFGSEEQKTTWLPKMAKGEAIGCFGLTEEHGGSDPANMITTATLEGDQWVINGKKRWIGAGTIADVAVIWARTDEGVVRAFLVPTDTKGYNATIIEDKLAMRSPLQAEIVLTDVRIPADAVLPESRGLKSALMCLNEARYGIAWGVMGAARDALEQAINYAMERQSFGEPIAAKQITQAKFADAFVEYEKGLLLALHLGRLKDAGKLTPGQISVGKLSNTREAIAICRAARTVLGGDGITSKFSVMRHMANLEAVRTYEGTDEVHQLVIGRELTGIAAF